MAVPQASQITMASLSVPWTLTIYISGILPISAMFHGDVVNPRINHPQETWQNADFLALLWGIPFRSPAAKEVPDPAQAQQATSLSDFGHAWDHHRRSAV